MTEKQYYQALANLSDRYLFENMSNREYEKQRNAIETAYLKTCLLYTSPSPRDLSTSRMPSSA